MPGRGPIGAAAVGWRAVALNGSYELLIIEPGADLLQERIGYEFQIANERLIIHATSFIIQCVGKDVVSSGSGHSRTTAP